MKKRNAKNAQTTHGEMLRVLECNIELLKNAAASPEVLGGLCSLLEYLRALPADEIARIYARPGQRSVPSESQRALELSDGEAVALDARALETILQNAHVSRKQLEHIAKRRFALTVGELSSFSREQLIGRLRTLIDNERTHDVIEQRATGSHRKPNMK